MDVRPQEIVPGVLRLSADTFRKRSDLHHRAFTATPGLLAVYERARTIGVYPAETRFRLEGGALVMDIPVLDTRAVHGAHMPPLLALLREVPAELLHPDIWVPQNYGWDAHGSVRYFDIELLTREGRNRLG